MRTHVRAKTFGASPLTLTLCVILLGASMTPAQGPERRIRFVRGQDSTTVKGRLVNTRRVEEAWQNYVLGVRKGQMITVRLTSQGDRAGLRLTFPDRTLAEDADGNAGHKSWSGEAPATGDCRVEVSHGSGARVTEYTLELTVR